MLYITLSIASVKIQGIMFCLVSQCFVCILSAYVLSGSSALQKESLNEKFCSL